MQKSESIGNLAAALNEVQKNLKPVAKDATVDTSTRDKKGYSYSYVSFEAVWENCRELLGKNGLSVCQLTRSNDAREIVIETILMHSSGEFISGELAMPVTQNTPQAIGSALTYARRYSFAGMIGIVADEDDDAGAASQPPKTTVPKQTGNVTPINGVQSKIQNYRNELTGICNSLKYSTESKTACLEKFDRLKTEEEKYLAVVKMREKLAAYNKQYNDQPEEPESIKTVVTKEKEPPSPRELLAIQIFEGLKDPGEIKLTVKSDSFELFCPDDKENWQDYILKVINGKTTCDCTAFTSISKNKPEFRCEHIVAVSRYLNWKKAMEEAA